MLAALAIVGAVVWLLADTPNRVQPAKAKMFYTAQQLHSETWTGTSWLALLGGLIAASLVGIPSGLQFACLFPFVPSLKGWAFIVIAQTLSTWLILRRYVGRGLPESASSLGDASRNAGDPLRLAWLLRLFLGLPNRSIDLALAARTDATHTPKRIALWSLPGHCLRAAAVGLWIHAIALMIMDFRPFPEYDFAFAGVMTVVLSILWLFPWMPEFIPGGPPVQRLVSVCAGDEGPVSVPTAPPAKTPAPGQTLESPQSR